MRSVVTERADHVGQLCILTSERASIAERAEILAGVETERRGIAPGAGLYASDVGAVSLGGVLEQEQPPLAAELRDRRHVSHLAVEVDRQDRLHVRREGCRKLSHSKVARILVGLDKHGAETVLRDGEDRRDVGIRRDRDAVAVLEQAELLPPAEGEDQRRETIGRADAMGRADPSGELAFESLHLVAEDIPTRVDDAGRSGLQFGGMPGVDGLEV